MDLERDFGQVRKIREHNESEKSEKSENSFYQPTSLC
jgi:hypothetical protein